ncbi:MAG: hypothetical protein BGP06_07750 [Rhizobiales bacterium 65-9]|nr:hypothetical protein [Hyphomicrobiales bacterium]OJY35691.1 MAG: hypothetical protein BGP06_07750 [Rhizobiales bacterium 65-9]
MLYLGLDAGGSAARWTLVDKNGALVARGETHGFSGHIHDEAVKRRIETAVAAIAGDIAAHDAVAGAHAGVSGLSASTPEANWVASRIADALGVAAGSVTVEDDVSLAYRTSFAPGAGLIVYAGTGSLALHLTDSGERWRAGGHGVLIDDEGSAAWIAREALRRLLAQDDASPGLGWETPLGRAFGSRFGGADWPSARTFVYGAHRGAIGQLARAVADASREGDPIARATLSDAGGALASLAKLLLARTGPLPVALSGGALRLSPLIAESFLRALGDGVEARIVEADAALAAARIAADAGTDA